MKELQTRLINSIFKADLLLFKDRRLNKTLSININSLNQIVSSIKQLIKALHSNRNLPLFLVCQNKQYSILLKRYLGLDDKKNRQIFIISYKVAVTLRIPAVYFLIDCQDSSLLCTKIQQQSNSLIYLIEKKNINKVSKGEYILSLNLTCIKQILFILTLIKKIKINNENI